MAIEIELNNIYITFIRIYHKYSVLMDKPKWLLK